MTEKENGARQIQAILESLERDLTIRIGAAPEALVGVDFEGRQPRRQEPTQ